AGGGKPKFKRPIAAFASAPAEDCNHSSLGSSGAVSTNEVRREQDSNRKEEPIWRDEIHAEPSDWRAQEHAKSIEHDKSGIGASEIRSAVPRAEMGKPDGVKAAAGSAPYDEDSAK